MPRCGNCQKNHSTVDEVKACYKGQLPGSNSPGTYNSEPASEKQLEFLFRLADEKDTGELSADKVKMIGDLHKMMDKSKKAALHLFTKQEVSTLISSMVSLPYSTKERWPGVPDGKYAFTNQDGTISFWEVNKPTEGQYAGRCFVNQIIGAPGDWRREKQNKRNGDNAMAAIAADPQKAAALFGLKTRSCGRCGAPLSNVRSRAAGYGERCANKAGWSYPSRDEARRILREMGEDPDAIEQLELPEYDGDDVKAEDVFDTTSSCTPGQQCIDINQLCTKHQSEYQAKYGRASNE